jgi:hypothetical protein
MRLGRATRPSGARLPGATQRLASQVGCLMNVYEYPSLASSRRLRPPSHSGPRGGPASSFGARVAPAAHASARPSEAPTSPGAHRRVQEVRAGPRRHLPPPARAWAAAVPAPSASSGPRAASAAHTSARPSEAIPPAPAAVAAPSPAPAASAVVFLCVRPSPLLQELATPLCPYHEVYLCPDEPCAAREATPFAPGLLETQPGESEAAGFLGTVSFLPRRASSRCKALYHLCRGALASRGHAHVWLVEEDAFLPTEATLLNMDLAHPAADLLSPHHHLRFAEHAPDVNHWSGERRWNHWERARGHVPFPWASSLVCAVRASRALLSAIATHAARHGRLFFCEVMFNSLALHAGLVVACPPALARHVTWRQTWDLSRPFHPAHVYHPMKNLSTQLGLRRRHYAQPSGAWLEFADAVFGDAAAARARARIAAGEAREGTTQVWAAEAEEMAAEEMAAEEMAEAAVVADEAGSSP